MEFSDAAFASSGQFHQPYGANVPVVQCLCDVQLQHQKYTQLYKYAWLENTPNSYTLRCAVRQ
jgi:hypothetical protein